MVDELKQKISQLLDDDLSYQEALSLLKKLHGQPGFQQQLHRYEAISHVLKSDAFIAVDADFAQRVSRSIQAEPIYLIPQRQSIKKRYAAVSALAASLAAVALLSSRNIDHSTQLQRAPLAQSQPAMLAGNTQLTDTQPNSDSDSTRTRFIEYLQAHNSSRYIDGSINLQPYARTVQYQQE